MVELSCRSDDSSNNGPSGGIGGDGYRVESAAIDADPAVLFEPRDE
jgi:hypothetical protein